MGGFNPIIHAPVRLQLVTMLSTVSAAEFSTLRDSINVSDSVLSKHISTLTKAGFVRSRKGVHLGHRTTWVELTEAGRAATREHVAAVREIIDRLD